MKMEIEVKFNLGDEVFFLDQIHGGFSIISVPTSGVVQAIEARIDKATGAADHRYFVEMRRDKGVVVIRAIKGRELYVNPYQAIRDAEAWNLDHAPGLAKGGPVEVDLEAMRAVEAVIAQEMALALAETPKPGDLP